jgi:hypothetical protein
MGTRDMVKCDSTILRGTENDAVRRLPEMKLNLPSFAFGPIYVKVQL